MSRTRENVVEQLVAQAGSAQAVKTAVASLDESELYQVSSDLKKRALYYLRRDAGQALTMAELIFSIGLWRDAPRVRALGLQTKAIALTLALREFEEALALFDESEEIYREHGDDHPIAVGEISRVWALACLQRFDEALEVGAQSAEVLTRHEDFVSLAALNNNLAIIYGRRGQDQEAYLRILDVETAYGRLGEEGELRLTLALINKAIVLRNLGRYEESIVANKAGLALARRHSQTANIARAKQNLGITYFLIGRFAKAQVLLEKARDTFIRDKRLRDAILVELFISDGLLHLRRFEEVLEKCRQVISSFGEAGIKFEVAQALLNEATALTGLNDHAGALNALARARRIFNEEENHTWSVYTDLEEAAILYRRRQYEASEQLATTAASFLRSRNLSLKEALALIVAGRSALANGCTSRTQELLDQATAIARRIDVPVLTYQAAFLKGQLALADNHRARALAAYEEAIRELERLQEQIMVEFRSDFLSDKDEIYARAVALCLDANNPGVALEYAERAKSRALLTMLAHHIDLGIEARSTADQPLVEEILRLRDKRDRLYRRWETGETPGSTVNREEEQAGGQAARDEARQLILKTEDEIRALWHSLLVRNSAYAREAALWQVQTRLDQKALGPDTMLVEYFTLPDGLVVFLISANEIKAMRLPVEMSVIDRQRQKLDHNFSTLQRAPHLAKSYTLKAQRILKHLYDELAAPWIEEAKAFQRLIIVPHGPLHYLPFNAFFDGESYLIQRFEISYLPGSSFLNLGGSAVARPLRTLVMGHTQDGQLPQIRREVETVGAAFNAPSYLDEEATRSLFQEQAPECDVLHIAAHGDFQAANPLFSGLYLEDGLLTTLDVFNLRLHASLATLSACQTGHNLVRGGDELFGLMRAFLASGTESLVLTLWPVEDKTTTRLMHTFYNKLVQGAQKIRALQEAQIALLEEGEGTPAAHPFYWSPFILVGDPGPLLN